MNVGSALRTDWIRLRDSIPAIIQIAVAAVSSYLLAQWVLGQPAPLIAAIVPIGALGFVGDARPVRVAETAFAMTLGITLAEVLLLVFGQSVVTFAVALVVTLVLARFVSPKAAFAIAAAVQCTLVMLAPVVEGNPFVRTLDALIGGAVAIVATALLPRDPWGLAERAGHRLLRAHVMVLGQLGDALTAGESDEAHAALARARSASTHVEHWRETVESGAAIARVSPWYWRRRADFARLQQMIEPFDLMTRGLRILARRSDYLVEQGVPQPELGATLHHLAEACDQMNIGLQNADSLLHVREGLLTIAGSLHPESIMARTPTVYEANIVHAIRPYLVDALTATGMSLDDARATLVPLE